MPFLLLTYLHAETGGVFFRKKYWAKNLPGNCYCTVEAYSEHTKRIRWGLLRKYLTIFSRSLFSQVAPSYTFDRVLNTLLYWTVLSTNPVHICRSARPSELKVLSATFGEHILTKSGNGVSNLFSSQKTFWMLHYKLNTFLIIKLLKYWHKLH